MSYLCSCRELNVVNNLPEKIVCDGRAVANTPVQPGKGALVSSEVKANCT